MQLIVLTLVIIAAVAGPATAAADPLSVRVRRDARLGGDDGRLIFRDDAIKFRTDNGAGTRRWAYDRLTRVVIAGPKRLELHTPARFAWLRLGRGGRDSFTVLDGGITPEVTDFLLRQIPVPVVSAWVPHDEPWRFRLAARHERRRHPTDGELRVAPDGSMAFVTSDDRVTRYWRRRDIAAVLPLDDNRLQIDVAEMRGGRPEPYVFSLREPLSPDAYAFLWAQITRLNRGGRS